MRYDKRKDTKRMVEGIMYESGENYLETILILKERNGTVRSIDIARELGFSKPSVSRAVGLLKDDGFIIIDSKIGRAHV